MDATGARVSGEETVLSVFLEAACPAFAGVRAGWSPGRLPIGVDGGVTRFLPWMEHAVTGSSVDPRRWHRVVSLPVGELGGKAALQRVAQPCRFDHGDADGGLEIAGGVVRSERLERLGQKQHGEHSA